MPKQAPRIVDHTHEEMVRPLVPPYFEPGEEVMTAKEAIEASRWLSTFNIWLYTRSPEPSIIYQLRDEHVLWEPGKLDVTAGGHYSADESGLDGLRELEEELGISVPHEHIDFFGRRLNVGADAKGRERKSVVSVYVAEYTGKLEEMRLQEEEVAGVVRVPVRPLMEVFGGTLERFVAHGIDSHMRAFEYSVSADSFPRNYDDYHQRMARFFAMKLGVSNAYLGN